MQSSHNASELQQSTKPLPILLSSASRHLFKSLNPFKPPTPLFPSSAPKNPLLKTQIMSGGPNHQARQKQPNPN